MATVASHSWFLNGPKGALHVTAFAPRDGVPRAGVLFFPPFAEEMNRARRMVSLQCRALAARGFHVIVADPYGTGDSDGDFGDSTWELWIESMAAAWHWLDARQPQVVAWSLRAGALLAAEVAARVRPSGAGHVMWQPASSGATVIDQFLRLRVAADVVAAAGARETAATLRAELASGRSLEIAGYVLSPSLAMAIDGRKLEDLVAPPFHATVFEVSTVAQGAPSPALGRLVERLRARGANIDATCVTGPSFWSAVETVVAEDLIEPTVIAVERMLT